MAQEQPNLYDVLGVARNAKVTDIGRAYNKFKADLAKDTTMPDHRRARRMEEAYATLSNETKRAAYDASLSTTNRKREGARGVVFAVIIVAGFALVAGGYLYMQRDPAQAPRGAPPAQDVINTAAASIGRLQSTDMSGMSTPLGLAVAVGDRALITSCNGITPGALLTVNIASYTIPVRVAATDDALGLCRLAADKSTLRSLPLTTLEPGLGATVYVAKLGQGGQVAVAEGKVNRVLDDAKARLVEPNVGLIAESAGAPLLDAFGRVVAVATVRQGDAKVRHVVVPAAWITEISEPPRERKTQAEGTEADAKAAEAKAAEAKAADAPPAPKLDNLPPERREKLEKAFRPPPNVPKDL